MKKRERRAMRECLRRLMQAEAPAVVAEELAQLGIGGEQADVCMAVMWGLAKKAMAGDVAAVKEVRALLGESADGLEDKQLRRAAVLLAGIDGVAGGADGEGLVGGVGGKDAVGLG